MLRTNGDVAGVVAPARQVIRSLDNERPVSDIHTMKSVLAKSISRAKFNTLLLTVFALIALLL